MQYSGDGHSKPARSSVETGSLSCHHSYNLYVHGGGIIRVDSQIFLLQRNFCAQLRYTEAILRVESVGKYFPSADVTLSRGWILKLCHVLIRNGLKKAVAWTSYTEWFRRKGWWRRFFVFGSFRDTADLILTAVRTSSSLIVAVSSIHLLLPVN